MSAEPPSTCDLCPRLVAFLSSSRLTQPTWHNAPVSSFGDPDARVLIVGLAPGLGGANRTGRPFTGDFAGDLLYRTLARHDFTRGTYRAAPNDGLDLVDCMITNAVRCVPPGNKPTAKEIATCRRFLKARVSSLPKLEIIVALGRIAHQSVVVATGHRQSDVRFAHGARHEISHAGRPLVLFDSFHCSRYNTNTGRLTEPMFDAVFSTVRASLRT
ncbi:MAG: uracil-DNA glycosylase [Hyphomicrobiaceae bacterium]